jgi:hypothetical protein
VLPADPATVFGLKMALCLALFLLAAAWLRRRVARIQGARGLPPESASASQALSHYFGSRAGARSFEHERRLYRQTIRVLARELQRLDPAHLEAREALELLEEREARQDRCLRQSNISQPDEQQEQKRLGKLELMKADPLCSSID